MTWCHCCFLSAASLWPLAHVHTHWCSLLYSMCHSTITTSSCFGFHTHSLTLLQPQGLSGIIWPQRLEWQTTAQVSTRHCSTKQNMQITTDLEMKLRLVRAGEKVFSLTSLLCLQACMTGTHSEQSNTWTTPEETALAQTWGEEHILHFH